jgi:hypothetical protein
VRTGEKGSPFSGNLGMGSKNGSAHTRAVDFVYLQAAHRIMAHQSPYHNKNQISPLHERADVKYCRYRYPGIGLGKMCDGLSWLKTCSSDMPSLVRQHGRLLWQAISRKLGISFSIMEVCY